MQITNRAAVSRCWVKAVENDEHEHSGWLSVTELINPIRLRLLHKRHFDNIKVDVCDRVWALLGKAVHYILTMSSDEKTMTEQRFEITVGGRKISMQPDRVEPLTTEECKPYWLGEKHLPFAFKPGVQLWRLKDFKITGTYAVKMALERGKSEWIAQCNMYAYGLTLQGFPIVTADIEALMKDWDWLEANVKKTQGYPPIQLASVPVPLWDPEKTLAYMEGRVKAFEAAWNLPDEELPYCTIEERWGDPDRYAVKKIGGKACLPHAGNFESASLAEQFRRARPDAAQCGVEFRPGCSKRCERYCEVAPFCNQYNETIKPAF